MNFQAFFKYGHVEIDISFPAYIIIIHYMWSHWRVKSIFPFSWIWRHLKCMSLWCLVSTPFLPRELPRAWILNLKNLQTSPQQPSSPWLLSISSGEKISGVNIEIEKLCISLCGVSIFFANVRKKALTVYVFLGCKKVGKKTLKLKLVVVPTSFSFSLGLTRCLVPPPVFWEPGLPNLRENFDLSPTVNFCQEDFYLTWSFSLVFIVDKPKIWFSFILPAWRISWPFR